MPLMPGSPRPGAAATSDDGVYRSIFQQPHLEIPAIAPSYSWFEFLLHPDALQRHLDTLRHQQARGMHSATSAMELVREFLDQAQLVADEGNGRNNRYHALVHVAAQVALQMAIPLGAIEKQLPLHFQRLLLDGIVDFAESEESPSTATVPSRQAQLLHQRWTLRTLVRESQNGYLTSTNKNDAEEQMSGFQVALSELTQQHLQIAQSLQQTLAEDSRNAIEPQAQFDAFFDLAVYFFSFNAYEKAYECFSRALELVEDQGEALSELTSAQRSCLEGYLAACESVLETRSSVDTVMEDATDEEGSRFGGLTIDQVDDVTVESSNPQVEVLLRSGAKRQRDHYRAANDLYGFFVASCEDDRSVSVDPASLATTLRHGILQKVDTTGLPSDRASARNLVVFLTLHSCWDALTHWQELLPSDHSVRPHVEFAIVYGTLLQYIAASTTASASTESEMRQEFSVTRCNKLLSDLLSKRRELLLRDGINPTDDGDSTTNGADTEIAALLIDLPLWILDTIVCVCSGMLHRSSTRSLSDHRVSFDLNPYGDVAMLVAFAPENPKKKPGSETNGRGDGDTSSGDYAGLPRLATAAFLKAALPEIASLHARGVECLVRRCPREPRWHSARADLHLHPIVRSKQPSLADPRAALSGYLAAASLATNFFAEDVSVVDIIDQSSFVRLSQCLVKSGAHVAAAVLYQCFALEDAKYGLRVLQIAPESHDAAFFQYFWALPFLELLVHLHSNPKHFNHKYVTLLTHLIQSPELNTSNPSAVQKEVEQRILRCYFRDLCKVYLG